MKSRAVEVFKKVIFIFFIAVLVRLIFSFYLFPNYFVHVSTVGIDFLFDDYHEIASQIINGNGFILLDGTPVLHRPPLYPLLLTIPVSLANDKETATLYIQILNALFGGLSVWLVYHVTKVISETKSNAPIIASYIVAFFPFSIWITKTSIPENLLLVLVPLQLLFALRYLKHKTKFNLLMSGLVCGLLYLTHSAYIAYVLAAFFALLISTKYKQGIIIFLLFFIGFIIVAMPWQIRNRSLGHYSITSATGFGLHYLKGWYYFEQLKSGNPYFKNLEKESAVYANNYLISKGHQPIKTSKDRSDLKKVVSADKLAKEHFRNNFTENIIKAAIKAPLLWVRQQSLSRAVFNFILLLPLLYFALIGIRRVELNYLLTFTMPLLATSLALALVFIEDAPMRYALPLFPILAVLASVAMPAMQGRSD